MRSSISQLSLHKLEVFCTVAELKSVSRAAERLNLAQPVVSIHLKALSEKLGVPLLERSGRRISLTEDGQKVLLWAQDVITRTKELERSLSENRLGLDGKVNVGAYMTLGSYVLPKIIMPIRKEFPKGEISVHIATSALVTEAVRQGECDFAFTILDPKHDISGLEVQRLRDEILILAASDRSAIKDEQVSFDELSELPFITTQRGTPRREIEEHLLMEFGVSRTQIMMEFGHPEAIKRAVLAGLGVALLFQTSVSDELARGELRRIDTPGMELRVPVYLIRRKDKKLTQFQSAMLNRISDALLDQSEDRMPRTIDGA